VLSTDLVADGSPLTHQGTYRVWARVRKETTGSIWLRFAWDVGDLTNPAFNDAIAVDVSLAYYIVDLGAIRIDAAPIGTHRWRGQIQARAETPDGHIRIDKIWLQSVDDSAGALMAPVNPAVGLQDAEARDSFTQTAGNLNAKTASVGGAWATSGDATDFTVDATNHLVTRAVGTTTNGRLAVVGSALTLCVVRCDVKVSALPATSGDSVSPGIVARATDVSNLVALRIDSWDQTLQASATTGLVRTTDLRFPLVADSWVTLQLYIDESGLVIAWAAPQGGALGDPMIVVRDSNLATGGTLASGKVGLVDVGHATATRSYDNFAAWVPESDAVMHPSRGLELRTDGVYRDNSDGNGAGPVSYVRGDLPRLSPPGLELRNTEIFVKASRGDLGVIPDSGLDDFGVQVLYRPSYLFVPDPAPGS
jgi:hypothetical protein